MNTIDKGLIYIAQQTVNEIYHFIKENQKLLQKEHPQEVFTIMLEEIKKIDTDPRHNARNILYACNLFTKDLTFTQHEDYEYFGTNYINNIVVSMKEDYNIDLHKTFAEKGFIDNE